MPGIEGYLDIECQSHEGVINDVIVHSTRPVNLSQSFVGKPVANVLDTIPLIFSLCGHAQAIAAQRATDNQSPSNNSRHNLTAQDILVKLESIREHVFKIYTQWPGLFGTDAGQCDFSKLTLQLKQARTSLFGDGKHWCLTPGKPMRLEELETIIEGTISIVEEYVYHMSVSDWFRQSLYELETWSRMTNSCAAKSMATIYNNQWQFEGDVKRLNRLEISNSTLAQILSSPEADRFVAQPSINNNCYETSSVTRLEHAASKESQAQYGFGMVSRYWARLLDLANQCLELRAAVDVLKQTDKSVMNDGSGIGRVDSARGLLVHYAKVIDDIITDYKILAPTEWNFHPDGLVTKGLVKLTAAKKELLEQKVHVFIQSIDPCVDYKMRIH